MRLIHPNGLNVTTSLLLSSSTFVMHVVVVDRVECDYAATVCETSVPFVQWCDAYLRELNQRKHSSNIANSATCDGMSGSGGHKIETEMKATNNTETKTQKKDPFKLTSNTFGFNSLIQMSLHTSLITNAHVSYRTPTITNVNVDKSDVSITTTNVTLRGLLSCTVVCKSCLYHDYRDQIHRSNNGNTVSLSSSSTITNKKTGNTRPTMAICFQSRYMVI